MFGRGSVNGMELNALALNQGNFVEELTMAATVAVAPVLKLTRRTAARSTAITSIQAQSLLTARRRAPGTAPVAVIGTTKLTRRLPAIGASPVVVATAANVIRRVAPSSLVTVTIGGELRLSWKYIRQTELARVMRVRDFRRLQVQADLRRMRVSRDSAAMTAGIDRGEIP